MPIDANIIFQQRSPDVVNALTSGVKAGNEIAMQPSVNAMFREKLALAQGQAEEQKQSNDEATYIRQLRDMALDALPVKNALATGDFALANSLMGRRVEKIIAQGGDPSHTMDFWDRMRSGQITQAQAVGELDSIISGAQQAGALQGASNASMRSYEPRPMLDENGNFAGYAIPVVDASGNARMQPIPGSERAMSPIDLAEARENIGVQGYGQRRQIEAQTAPIIASGAKSAELDVEAEKRPEIEAAIAKARAEAEDLVQQTISKRSSSNTLESAQLLRTNLSGQLESIYGRGESLYPNLLRSQKGIDLIADRDQLVGMLTLAGRGQLKGQGTLTDQEQKTVQQAITVLSNPDISPARAEIALNDAFAVLETSAGRPSKDKKNQDTFEVDGVTVTRKR